MRYSMCQKTTQIKLQHIENIVIKNNPHNCTLTTAADNVVGTSGNETINASLAYSSGSTAVDSTSTLSAADQIAGGAGTDTLNVTVTGGNAGTTFAPALITGVETLNIRNVSGQTNSLDASTVGNPP